MVSICHKLRTGVEIRPPLLLRSDRRRQPRRELVVKEPGVGRDGAVPRVLLEQVEQEVAPRAELHARPLLQAETVGVFQNFDFMEGFS